MTAERSGVITKTPETLIPSYDLRTLDDLEREGGITGKVVLLRVDLDLPNGTQSHPDGDLRFENAISAVADLMKRGAKQVRILGHIGRPQEEMKKGEQPVSTRVLLGSFYRRLGVGVAHVPDNLDVEHISSLEPYPVLLYENVRMREEEEAEMTEVDENRMRAYVSGLAQGADSFVNDAFAVVHREKNKTVGALAHEFMGRNAAGDHLAAEMSVLSQVNGAERILFVIAGGKGDKKSLVDNLARFESVHIAVGGRLAILVNSADYPQGRVDTATLTVDGLDIDDESIMRFAGKIKSREFPLVVLNGPLGQFETGHIAGSEGVYDGVHEATLNGVTTIAGGGDTGNLLAILNEKRSETLLLSHYCPGGGAMLAAFEGDQLSALAPLSRQAA